MTLMRERRRRERAPRTAPLPLLLLEEGKGNEEHARRRLAW